RSVEDVALILCALSPSFARTYDSRAWGEQAPDVRNTSVAWWTDFGGVPFDLRVTAVVNAERRVFESLGCRVDAAEPDLSAADAVFRTLRAKAFLSKHGATVSANPSLVKKAVLDEIERGRRLTAADVDAAERARIELRADVARFMNRYAFFVLPTTQVPPFDGSTPYVTEINGVAMESYIDWMKSCYYISAIGHPALSLPCG